MLNRVLMITASFSLMSCYIYKPMDKVLEAKKTNALQQTEKRKQKTQQGNKKRVRLTKEEAIKNMKKGAYYKIKMINKKQYKIRYNKSTNDSIFGEKKSSKKQKVELDKKDIDTIKSRRFSKLNSDLITFSIFGGVIAGLIVLFFQ